jgi:hypothetical protein
VQGQNELPLLVLVLGHLSFIVTEVEADSDSQAIRPVWIEVVVAGTQQFCGLAQFGDHLALSPNSCGLP